MAVTVANAMRKTTNDGVKLKLAARPVRRDPERYAAGDRQAVIAASAVDAVPALIDYVDAGQRFLFHNRRYRDWFGKERIAGCSMREVLGADTYEKFRPHVESALSGRHVRFEADLSRGGVVRHVQINYVPDIGEDGKVRGFHGLTCDITPLKQTEQRLALRAQYDPLTGAANRFLFRDRLERAIARSRRQGKLMAVMYLDIDKFKPVNDELGHAAGDSLLRQFAARLHRCVRATDTVARLGGDEFTIVLENLGKCESAIKVAEKILKAVREPVEAEGRRLEVTTSIGMAFRRGEEVTVESLLKEADAALYEAKKLGRNRYCCAQAA